MLNIVLGIATVLTVDILSIPQLNLQHISEALESVFLIFIPNFCLGQGLLDQHFNRVVVVDVPILIHQSILAMAGEGIEGDVSDDSKIGKCAFQFLCGTL